MPANPIDLTTLAQAKAWMQVSSTGDDAIIQSVITAASRYWLWKTGRGPSNWQVASSSPFNQPVSFSETYDGNGNSQLFLRNFPINSVESLMVNGYSVPQSTSPTTAGWVIDNNAQSIVLRYASSGYFNGPAYSPGGYGWVGGFGSSINFAYGQQNVLVTYTAGFNTIPITGELQTIPSSGPYTVTTLQVWLADVSVTYFSSGDPLTRVYISPAVGQYYIQSPGVYLFNSADAGEELLIAYTAAGTPQDITLAVNQQLNLTYKRRGWVGLRSLAMSGVGQTNYSMWEFDPSILSVMSAYTRTALV